MQHVFVIITSTALWKLVHLDTIMYGYMLLAIQRLVEDWSKVTI